MASPHVAGAAALVMGLGISNAGSVAASLRSSARGGPSGAADARPPELYGAGILDAGAAVRSAFLGRLGGRLGLLVAVLVWVWRRVRRRRGQFAFTAGASFGALLGATGLIPFLPFVRALPRVGDVRPFVELLGRPVAEWDVGLGLGLHRWLPLATALPVLAAFGVLFGVRRLRPSLGGYAAGTSAVLLQLAVSLDVTMPLGASLTRVWLVANALACVWLARTALDASNART
jgi:serine protease